MTNIEKQHVIKAENLSGEFYFNSILQEAYACGLLNDSEIENIQLQCISLLSYKCERYNSGESSSIKVETAESIMKSNLDTIGVYLKSLPDSDYAADVLKKTQITELYDRGRKLLKIKFRAAKHLFSLVQKNKITTTNISYNSTLNEEGIGVFFKSYDLEYEAHETPTSIDYQLCNPVDDLEGVEFILNYLENLYLENEFCRHFSDRCIHHLLYGYDEGYKDLLINVFEQVLTEALGCSLAACDIRDLNLSKADIWQLYNDLSKYDEYTLSLTIKRTAENIISDLNIHSLSLKKYIESSLPKITALIYQALKAETPDRVFISPVNPDLKPVIHFVSAAKMDDEDYRSLVEELIKCRNASDKLALIRDKVKAFDDLEDILKDAQLCEAEIFSVLDDFKDIEVAELIRRHPYKTDIQAADLSETEQVLRVTLQKYINEHAINRKEEICQLANLIVDDQDAREY